MKEETKIPNEKICKKCNKTKELNKFYKHKTALYGRESMCKECKHDYYVGKDNKEESITPKKTIFFGIFH